MNVGVICSFILHATVVLLLVFGFFPSIRFNLPEETAISVEVLPIKDISNIKSQKKAEKRDKPEQAEAKKIVKAAKQEDTAPSKTDQPSTTPDKIEPVKKDAVKLPDKTKPKEKKDVKKPEPVKDKQPAKTEPKKDEKKKVKPKPTKTGELDSLLKTLEEAADVKVDKAKKNTKDAALEEVKDNAKGNYNDSKPLSMSEEDAIRNQIAQCWSVPAGARDAKDMSVLLNIKLERDGTVTGVKVIETKRHAADNQEFYRVAAESAVRAVKRCSPFKNLPLEKYERWRELELNFDPSAMLY